MSAVTEEVENGESTKQFTLDGEHVDIVDFLATNLDAIEEEKLLEIEGMEVGDEVLLGGGAAPFFTLARVA